MRTLKLKLSYDGTGYFGWQIQHNRPTIQGELARAFAAVTGEASKPVAGGRTDAGVHALEQVAHVHSQTRVPAPTLRRALNAHLPEQIVVRQVEDVSPTFHAIHDAISKMYRYVYHDGPTADVFLRRYSWKVAPRLDVERMDRAAIALEGEHDFRGFETEWPNRASSRRTIQYCRVRRLGELVYLEVQADGFLYKMVRAIAGTLYEVGRGRWPVDRVREIVDGGDRKLAGPNAPANGLFLARINYAPSEPGDS
jgi:tRNA pseudouridine38-40 synthase